MTDSRRVYTSPGTEGMLITLHRGSRLPIFFFFNSNLLSSRLPCLGFVRVPKSSSVMWIVDRNFQGTKKSLTTFCPCIPLPVCQRISAKIFGKRVIGSHTTNCGGSGRGASHFWSVRLTASTHALGRWCGQQNVRKRNS